MRYDPTIHHRRSIRLRGYDYTQVGAYFVTICVRERVCLFGKVADREMQLNEMGQVVVECWRNIPRHFPAVELDAFVVMPNHMHGILVLTNRVRSGVENAMDVETAAGEGTSPLRQPVEKGNAGEGTSPLRQPVEKGNAGAETAPLRRPTLGQVVAYFKYQSTKNINQRRGVPGSRLWQRNYYEHVIRDDTDLQQLREYVMYNPLKWELDQLHPNNPSKW
ncbi:transposase [Candidatus Poribacteria bacterium]|nr:transposase [Candidatus Poribacteria bacterium]